MLEFIRRSKKGLTMGYVTSKDGTKIHYRDWGAGRPVVFSHGWPLNGNAWDAQMLCLASNGFRAIAHDRRGHGLSAQPWDGNDMDHYADDLAAVLEALDLRDVVLVGHSTGGGEVTRYVTRHGSERVSKLVLVGAIPPLMVKTAENPNGTPIEIFDDLRTQLLDDRSQLWKTLSVPFYGVNRSDSNVSRGVLDQFWLMGMQVGLKAAYDCIRQFSETDYTDELSCVDVPTMLIHGDDDQIVPIEASARPAAELIPRADLRIYAGGSHGLFATHAERLNRDLLEFIKA